MNKKIKQSYKQLISLLVLLLLSLSCHSQANNSSWYYPWENKVSELQAIDYSEVIPSFINSKEYRILKISNIEGTKIKNIVSNSQLTSIELYQLPIINNFDNDKILDLIYPISLGKDLYDDNSADKYFLVKFVSKTAGVEQINLTIETELKKYSFSKKIQIGNFKNTNPIDLNVFAYFDYNFIVKDLRKEVIDDLVAHNTSTIVIPPSALPEFGNASASTLSLKNYIQGTANKFKYYILYLNLNHNNTNLLDISSTDLQAWYKNIEKEFVNINVDPKQILIFPYDESKGQDVNKVIELKNRFRSLNINNLFYATIDNVYSYKKLSGKIDFLQVIPEIMEKLPNVNNKSKLWTYQLTYGSRNRRPNEYRAMALRALKSNATGIGVWSYADVSVAADESNLQEFSRGIPTWKVDYKAWSAEYSLIYRQNNTIYSSLRWEALSYGIDDYFWFKMLKNKYGDEKVKQLTNSVLKDNANQSEIDKLKMTLL